MRMIMRMLRMMMGRGGIEVGGGSVKVVSSRPRHCPHLTRSSSTIIIRIIIFTIQN